MLLEASATEKYFSALKLIVFFLPKFFISRLPSIVHDRAVVVGSAKVVGVDFPEVMLLPCRPGTQTSHSSEVIATAN